MDKPLVIIPCLDMMNGRVVKGGNIVRRASLQSHRDPRTEEIPRGARVQGSPLMYCTESSEGVVLNVKAQPRSSKAGLDGILGDAVKVRIRSAPVDGKANKELIETLADAFDLPKSAVVFKGGETSKTKRLLLKGLTAAHVKSVVEG